MLKDRKRADEERKRQNGTSSVMSPALWLLCVTFSPRDIVGRDRNCAGRAPRLWDRRTQVTTVATGIWRQKLTQTLAHKEAGLQDGSSENSVSELRQGHTLVTQGSWERV